MVFRKVRLRARPPPCQTCPPPLRDGAVISEWIRASQGLGVFMIRSANSYLTARLFAAIALTSVLSIALFGWWFSWAVGRALVLRCPREKDGRR